MQIKKKDIKHFYIIGNYHSMLINKCPYFDQLYVLVLLEILLMNLHLVRYCIHMLASLMLKICASGGAKVIFLY